MTFRADDRTIRRLAAPCGSDADVPSGKRIRRVVLGTTALVGFSISVAAGLPGIILLSSLAATSALADGGAGSAGYAYGGVGGADSAPGIGGLGGNAPVAPGGGSGGGGGAGATGGAGGNGDAWTGVAGLGGAGGVAAGSAGQVGGNGTPSGGQAGGGGGGGGAHGYVGATLPVVLSIGGNGGNGGVGTNVSSYGDGGGGGAGGYGAVVTGGGGGTLTSTVTGGNGGNGGLGYLWGDGGTGGIGLHHSGGASFTANAVVSGGQGGTGANGGAGGAGIYIAAGSTGIFTANAVITGGNGGNGGVTSGAGGVGVYLAAGSTITNAGTISGGLSGDGVTRANAITFAGGINILELQAGSHIIGNVVAFGGADTLRLGGAGNASFDVAQIGAAAQYQNFGVFEKTGVSVWSLTGNTSEAMPWAVNAGTLAVNAAMANATMTVNNGGTLAGVGTVGAVTVANGGTLAPGNSVGTITVSGNLTFGAGGFYAVEISPSAADRTNVTGTATLGGATVNAIFTGGGYVERQYTIVNAAGGIVGSFSTLAMSNLPSGFKSSLGYDLHNAYLNLVLDLTPTPTPTPTPSPTPGPAPTPAPAPAPLPINSGLNVNQTRTANALSDYFARVGRIPIVFGALTPTGLSIVAGEVATATQQTTFDAMDLFLGLLTDPFSAGRTPDMPGGASHFADASAGRGPARDAYAMITKASWRAPPEPRWNVWAAGFGGSQTTDGNATLGSSTATSRIYGTAVGADYWLTPYTVAGFALAGGGTNFGLANGLGAGNSDLFQAGGFVRHTVGATYLTAAAAYGWQDITTDRMVGIAGLNQFRAHFNANAFSGRLEGGNRIVAPLFGGVGLTPYAAIQVTAFELPAYAEQVLAGVDTFALSYGAKVVTATRSELGLRSDISFALTDATLTLRGRAAWAHDFNTDRSALATFQVLPGASFLVNGAAQARDAARVTASAETKWLNGWSVAGAFEGEFSNVTQSYAGKGVVRYAW